MFKEAFDIQNDDEAKWVEKRFAEWYFSPDVTEVRESVIAQMASKLHERYADYDVVAALLVMDALFGIVSKLDVDLEQVVIDATGPLCHRAEHMLNWTYEDVRVPIMEASQAETITSKVDDLREEWRSRN
jgi:hypothetical protein